MAWCSIAPRESYRNLGGPILKDDEPDKVWSLVCFFVMKDLRRTGVSRRLIEAAIRYAKKAGARVMEAYPVTHNSPSYRFMGEVPLFKAAGFKEVGLAGTRRHVMRKSID